MLGNKIYIGGSFNNADGDALADNVALWTNPAWTHLGTNGAGDGPIKQPGLRDAIRQQHHLLAASSSMVAGWQPPT
ncbi:MAG: hypothetical protein U0838_05040 [Chloroflexota bacterium]